MSGCHGLLEGVASYKHVWKMLDAAREASSYPHEIEMDDSIDAAIALGRVVDEVAGTLAKKAQQRERFTAANITQAIDDLRNSRQRLEALVTQKYDDTSSS